MDASGTSLRGRLHFPCRYPIKVFGEGGADFADVICALVLTCVPELDRRDVAVRESRGGRFQSVTLVVPVDAQAQVDALHRTLAAHPRVVMVL